jgi:hypothetical protein
MFWWSNCRVGVGKWYLRWLVCGMGQGKRIWVVSGKFIL